MRIRLIARVQKMGTLALSRFEDVKAALNEILHLDHIKDEVETNSCKAFYFLGGQAFLIVTVGVDDPVYFTDYYGHFGASLSSEKKVPLDKVLDRKWLESYGERLQGFIDWTKEHEAFRKKVLEKVKKQGLDSLNQDELDTLEAIQADQEAPDLSLLDQYKPEFSKADKDFLRDLGIKARRK
jgi:hypothetical protein